jgi:F0F1-type ATP synthase alpha subunit
MDSIPVADVRAFEAGLREYVNARHGALLAHIRETGELGDAGAIVAAIADFKATFQTSAESA